MANNAAAQRIARSGKSDTNKGISNLELAELAMNSLRYRSLRSWLAILGIVIGVASIVSLISISTGLNQNIQKSLGGTGANLITISAGASRATGGFGGGAPPGETGQTTSKPITFTEAQTIKHVPGVANIDARLQGNGRINYRGKNSSVTVVESP